MYHMMQIILTYKHSQNNIFVAVLYNNFAISSHALILQPTDLYIKVKRKIKEMKVLKRQT